MKNCPHFHFLTEAKCEICDAVCNFHLMVSNFDDVANTLTLETWNVLSQHRGGMSIYCLFTDFQAAVDRVRSYTNPATRGWKTKVPHRDQQGSMVEAVEA